MISSRFVFLQLSIVVLIMVTLSATTKIPQSTDDAVSQHQNNERPSTSALENHQHRQTFKHDTLNDINTGDDDEDDDDDDALNTNDSEEEEYRNDYYQDQDNQAIWSPVFHKRYAKKLARGGSSSINVADGRLWAIPYRFGKRASFVAAALPYRFGKRAAAIHFQFGKKNAAL
ncbi:unnamed protein product [Adineta ricciae]|uniref:Uncharacterized protein n=1 Tax=Adineta ricciae TaxID=249248 RepID=A0A816BVB6_ADIRI|nr:unnamed protein product [Adineta ricciae]